MVMPRSRSMSMESRYCSRIRRGSTAPVISRMRSDRVDLPWSTWLMMEKLRMRSTATGPVAVAAGGTVRRSYRSRSRPPGRLARELGLGRAVRRRPWEGRHLLQLFPAPVGSRSAAAPFSKALEDRHVANIKSQIKRNRQNEKRRLRNKSVRAELRTRTKSAVTAAEIGAEDSAELLRLAVKRIDKAAAQGVIHKNTAANHKSRLVRRIAAIEAKPPSKRRSVRPRRSAEQGRSEDYAGSVVVFSATCLLRVRNHRWAGSSTKRQDNSASVKARVTTTTVWTDGAIPADHMVSGKLHK